MLVLFLSAVINVLWPRRQVFTVQGSTFCSCCSCCSRCSWRAHHVWHGPTIDDASTHTLDATFRPTVSCSSSYSVPLPLPLHFVVARPVSVLSWFPRPSYNCNLCTLRCQFENCAHTTHTHMMVKEGIEESVGGQGDRVKIFVSLLVVALQWESISGD